MRNLAMDSNEDEASAIGSGQPSASASMNKLSSNTVRLIASAQVITSVFSVVKELLENSLDAGAKCIEIKLENYGFNRIEVRDNGSGIDMKDVAFMALPHYTSKITSSEDLHQLQTYGFRGEALGALSAVADVTITTKTSKDEAGTQYTLNNKGEIHDRKPSHLGTGTTVTAVNLFKNMPVRKQYYGTAKKCREELKKVEDLVTAFSIIRHDVRFWLRHNKDMVFQSTAVSSSRDVLIKVLGTTAMSCMERKSSNWLDPELRMELCLPKKASKWQQMSRTNKDRFFLFVNKRPVEMKAVEKELKTYYNKAMGCENRWPLGFLSLQVPSEEIDVNLEPNKNRILLQNQGDVLLHLMELLGEFYGPIEVAASPSKAKSAFDDSLDLTNSNMSDSSLLGCGLPQPLRHNSDEPVSAPTLPADNTARANIVRVDVLDVEPDRSIPRVSTDRTVPADKDELMHVSMINECDINNTAHSIIQAGPSECSVNIPMTQTVSDFDIVDNDFMSSTPLFADCGIKSNDEPRPAADTTSMIQPRIQAESAATIAQVAQDVIRDHKVPDDGPVVDNKITSNLQEADIAEVMDEGHQVGENWSKGTSLLDKDGKHIQPVVVLTNTAGTEESGEGANIMQRVPGATPVKKSSNSVILNTFTSPLVSTTPLVKKKLPTVATPDQPSLFEMMGTNIKKPTTAFIFFSKENRPRVIKENPGASFQDIAKIIGEKWNKLTTQEKSKYENMMSTDVKRYREEKRKLSTSLSSDISIYAKKPKLDNGNAKSDAITKKKSEEEERRTDIYEVKTDFSLAKLKVLYQKGGDVSKLGNSRSTNFRLISQMKTAPIWLGVQEEQVCAFYPIRAQETLIYERLLANHSLSADRLENPIRIMPSMFSAKLWLTLLGLSKSDTPRTDIYVYYDDTRLLKNGFSVRQYEKCEDLYVEIVGMFDGMNLYGVTDLHEILQAITENPSCQLQHCRSSKIKQYLQGEAVRMARQLPQRLSFEETRGVLQEVHKKLPVTTTSCFHKKPFLKSLYDLHSIDVTLTQGFTPPETSQSK